VQRFKAWLFIWLMGEHFAAQERELAELRTKLDDGDKAMRDALALVGKVNQRISEIKATPTSPAKIIRQARNWADFQRLSSESDTEVQ
jgi:hypothetical protein